MRGTQSLYYTNPGPHGQREIVIEEDPRQAVKVYSAGDFISEARARELGIYEWLISDDPSGRQAQVASEDPEAQARKAVDAAAKVRAESVERQSWRATSVEERAYVENAVGTGTQLSAAERGEAGSLGAEITGPTIPEVAETGSYQAATDKAAAEMTSGETPPEEKPAAQAPSRAPSMPPSPGEMPSGETPPGETPPRAPVRRP